MNKRNSFQKTIDRGSLSCFLIFYRLNDIITCNAAEICKENIFMSMSFDDLKREYIQAVLYGSTKKKKRRTPAEIEADIRELSEINSDEAIQELQGITRKLQELAQKAVELHQKGLEKDANEVVELLEQSPSPSENSYILKVFTAPIVSENTVNHSASSGKLLKIDPNDFFIRNQPEEVANQQKTSKMLGQILKYRSWVHDADKMRELELLVEDIGKLDAAAGAEAAELLKAGKILADLFGKAFLTGKNGRPFPEKLIDSAKKANATQFELEKLKSQFQKGQDKRSEFQNGNDKPVRFVPPRFSSNDPLPYLLSKLKPSRYWRIMVDETGEVFDRQIFEQGVNKRRKGKFVAVAIPEENDLPRITSFHATDSGTAAIAELMFNLLQAKTPCGIIGVTLDSMLNLPMNYWYNGLERLIDLILRQLPLDNAPVKLDFMIEERGSVTDLMVQRAADSCLYRFAKAYPEKAGLLEVTARVYSKKKTSDQDFMAYNGYVDSFACAWNGGRHELTSILKKYRLLHTCLLEGDVQNLYEVMDNAAQGIPVPGTVWNDLIVSPDAGNADSVISSVLAQLGSQVCKDLELWKNYLNTALAHLNSKAIHLPLLSRQISWLKKYSPGNAELPPLLQLTWLTAELALNNHTGVSAMEYEKELLKLITRLYEEDAPLTCWAILNLAVMKTNAYEFEAARKLIRDYNQFSSLLSPEPPFTKFLHSLVDLLPGSKSGSDVQFAAVTGLRYYGQLLSTCGQHEAFLGDNRKAVVYFQEAIKCFEKLSENRESDISHTMAYYATAQMDIEPKGDLTRELLEQYLKLPLLKAVEHYAVSVLPEEKYHHHILLRYLVQLDPDSPAVKRYLELAEVWKNNQGHPWEMIEFYRGVLSADPVERMKHWETAHSLCQGYDATLHVIDAVIMGSILTEDDSIHPEYEAMVDLCAQELPALKDRIRILREQPEKRLPPLELAAQILPFNFR